MYWANPVPAPGRESTQNLSYVVDSPPGTVLRANTFIYKLYITSRHRLYQFQSVCFMCCYLSGDSVQLLHTSKSSYEYSVVE